VRAWLLCCAALTAAGPGAAQPAAGWHAWSAAQAESIGRSGIARGRVAGGRRLLNTERAYSYKLAATWFTPDVIHAAARLLQLRNRFTGAQVEALIADANAPAGIVVMVDLDPDEGSGVIPLDWQAFLQPRGVPDRAVEGAKAPKLRAVRLLQGVLARNYDYDRFWVVFPRQTAAGEPLFRDTDREAELVVRIYEREGRVTWPIPASIRGPEAPPAS
jgi:hypothetical protein